MIKNINTKNKMKISKLHRQSISNFYILVLFKLDKDLQRNVLNYVNEKHYFKS